MANKQEINAQYTQLDKQLKSPMNGGIIGTEMKDLSPVVVLNEDGNPEIVKLEIKHQATDFDDKGHGTANEPREGFFKFLVRRDVPQRAVFLAFSFVIIGALLFLLGFVEDLQEWDPFHGFLFWGAGFILFCPGIYFVFKVFQAYRCVDPHQRSNILREIPDL